MRILATHIAPSNHSPLARSACSSIIFAPWQDCCCLPRRMARRMLLSRPACRARQACGAPNGLAMSVKAPIRIVAFGLLASSAALCQTRNVQTTANPLPDAPSVQNASAQAAAKTQSVHEVFDAARVPRCEQANVRAASASGAAHFDLGHFDLRQPNQNGSRDLWAKRIFTSTPSQSSSHHSLESESLIGRAGDAAASVLVTHDDAGRKRLNTSYLLRVLTTTAAHSAAARSAYVPYWRRPASHPASDFGSTIGNDAGMNVFHEFKPGILQLVRSHEPKFLSAIGERISNK